jgi:hypothetical protein
MRYLAAALLLITVSGCGVMLGEPYVRQQDRLVERRAGRAEPWSAAYAAATTAAFDPAALTAELSVRITKTRFCRRYAETVFERAEVTGRTVATRGVFVDGAIFLSAAAAGILFVENAGGQAALAVVGAIPLGADAYVHHQYHSAAPVTLATRAPDPGPGTDSAGLFPCEVTRETAAPLEWNGVSVHAGRDGRYVVRLDEEALASLATTTSVVMTPLLAPAAGSTAGLPVEARLGAAYTAFAVTRDTVRRYPTPLRVARFVTAYPRSKAAAEMRTYLDTMMPSFRDAEELRAAAAVPGLDAALRRALHERFELVYLDEIVAQLPGLLKTALGAERNANTFLLNGFTAEGNRLLAEKDRALAAACRLKRDYELRAGPGAVLAKALDDTLSGDDRVAADRWLDKCP